MPGEREVADRVEVGSATGFVTSGPQSQQPQTRSSTEHSGALPLHRLRAAILFHPRNACLYRRVTISSSMRAVIEVRREPPPSTWAVTVTTASLSGEIMQSWP